MRHNLGPGYGLAVEVGLGTCGYGAGGFDIDKGRELLRAEV